MTLHDALTDLPTPEAHVAWVERQMMKHEMTGGRLVVVPGAGNAHARVAGNILADLRGRLRGRRCRPFGSDFMVQIAGNERYYPDASVACEETRDYTDRPVLVVEVLSPSTERFDRKVKQPNYLAQRGLRYVLYVVQDRPHAELYRPDETDGEVPITMTSLDSGFQLPEFEVMLSMAEIDADVTFAAPAPWGSPVLPLGVGADALRWLDGGGWRPIPIGAATFLGCLPNNGFRDLVLAAYARFRDYAAAGVAHH